MSNIDVMDYFAGDMKYMNRPKSAAVKDIDIAKILGQKYGYCIDIGNGDINPRLLHSLGFLGNATAVVSWVDSGISPPNL